MDTNRKGAIAEIKIAAAAIELGIPVLRPMVEHGRYDLAFEIADRILRVQCKWGGLDDEGAVIRVALQTSCLTPAGYVPRRTVPTRSISLPCTAQRLTVATFFRVLWPAGERRST
jgi:hypothetical protein